MKHIIHCLILFPLLIGARTVDYQLTVAEKNVTPKGKTSTALTINNSIPSPTLYFNEGDVARIEVRNAVSMGRLSFGPKNRAVRRLTAIM